MNENKVKVWLVRDMNGSLYLSQIKPKKEKFDWVIENPEYANNYVKNGVKNTYAFIYLEEYHSNYIVYSLNKNSINNLNYLKSLV